MSAPCGFEQGPIRPPSEAGSLLVRVTRNCPWNRCAFCPVYKGRAYGKRELDEILADLDAMARASDRVTALSERLGHGGEVTRPVIERVYGDPALQDTLPVAWWRFHGGRTVFLQDANALASPERKVLGVLRGIAERFPAVDRITTYSQSRTLQRQPRERLRRYREAGLTRVHVGLETGSDAVMALMTKGATAAMHIEGGRRVLDAGMHLCTYVMPGLGGVELRDDHVAETARVLRAIEPSAVRLRSLVVPPRGPLAELVEAGRFTPQGEAAVVAEIRELLAALDGVRTTLVSDHDLNLLPELEGALPGDRERLLAVCDTFLGWDEVDRSRFVLGRRTGQVGRVADLEQPGVRDGLDALAARIGVDLTQPIDGFIQEIRRRMV